MAYKNENAEQKYCRWGRGQGGSLAVEIPFDGSCGKISALPANLTTCSEICGLLFLFRRTSNILLFDHCFAPKVIRTSLAEMTAGNEPYHAIMHPP